MRGQERRFVNTTSLMLGRCLRDRANEKNGCVDSGADLVAAIILLYYGF